MARLARSAAAPTTHHRQPRAVAGAVPAQPRRCVRARFQQATRSLHDASEVPASADALALHRAECDIREWCNDGHAESCDVLDWFTRQVQDAEASRALHGDLGEGARKLTQQLREVAASASGLEAMVRSMALLKRIEEGRALGFKAAAPSPAEAWPQHGPPLAPACCSSLLPGGEPPPLDEEQRGLLAELFVKADANGDGQLSWSEFNRAMAWIGDELSEEQQELVSSALDLDGSVSLDQFLAIVQIAETELRGGSQQGGSGSLGSSDARFLRHLTHTRPDGSGHSAVDRMMM